MGNSSFENQKIYLDKLRITVMILIVILPLAIGYFFGVSRSVDRLDIEYGHLKERVVKLENSFESLSQDLNKLPQRIAELIK